MSEGKNLPLVSEVIFLLRDLFTDCFMVIWHEIDPRKREADEAKSTSGQKCGMGMFYCVSPVHDLVLRHFLQVFFFQEMQEKSHFFRECTISLTVSVE